MTNVSFFQVLAVILFCISNAHSKGSPWDWQSVNAKVADAGEKNTHYERGRRFPEAVPVHSNISVLEGHTALLPCRIGHLGEYTVSWLRGRDTSILSVGLHKFSTDQRISVVQLPLPDLEDTTDFSLQIESVTSKDIGWYDCQVNTEPKISQKCYLFVIEAVSSPQQQQDSPGHGQPQMIPQMREFLQSFNSPKVSIAGPSQLWFDQGESLILECTINHLTIPPSQMHWSLNGRLLKERPDLVIRNIDEVTTRIRIDRLRPEDGGLYACLTDGSSKPASVDVKIAQAAKLHGPVALANMKKSDEDSPEAFVFEQEVEARLEIAEAKLARLESQVNSLLLRQGELDGAKALASRVSSSTIPQSTVVLVFSVLASLIHLFMVH